MAGEAEAGGFVVEEFGVRAGMSAVAFGAGKAGDGCVAGDALRCECFFVAGEAGFADGFEFGEESL